jgi:hypothetical protein
LGRWGQCFWCLRKRPSILMYTISLSIDGKVNIADAPAPRRRAGFSTSHTGACAYSSGHPEPELQVRLETFDGRCLCSGSTLLRLQRRCSGAQIPATVLLRPAPSQPSYIHLKTSVVSPRVSSQSPAARGYAKNAIRIRGVIRVGAYGV